MVVKIVSLKSDVILNKAVDFVRSGAFPDNVSVSFHDGYFFFHVPDFHTFLSVFWKSFCFWSRFSVGSEMRRRRYVSVWLDESNDVHNIFFEYNSSPKRIFFYFNESVKGISYGRV